MTEYKPRITEKDRLRYVEMARFEDELQAAGFSFVCGVDEAGRGPLAGPVVAAACILDSSITILGLNDSKKLSEKKRLFLAEEIKNKALAYNITEVNNEVIDEINILEASKRAMLTAVKGLAPKADFALVDAVYLAELQIPQKALLKGDSCSNSIAAASILAKTHRDSLMIKYAKEYPEYDFDKHKGYGTKGHYSALAKHGLSPIHRLSFLKKLKAGSSKNKAKECGLQAENVVATHLLKQGYKILESNFELRPFGEIDLIAQKGRQLFFIEVKARKANPYVEDSLLESIDSKKMSKIRLLASYYIDSRSITNTTSHLLAAFCILNSCGQVEHIHYKEIL